MNKVRVGKREIAMLMILTFVAAQAAVASVTTPTAGWAYDVYDILVNQMLKGPVGFSCGVAAMAFAAVKLMGGQVMGAIAPAIGGAMLLKSDTLTSSLGSIF
jgi:hypothetical protein